VILRQLSKIASLARFRLFERSIHHDTRIGHDKVLAWALQQADGSGSEAEHARDEVAREGIALVEAVRREFGGKYSRSAAAPRIMIHLPPVERSPGGHSLFRNLGESLRFIGIPTELVTWTDPFAERIDTFRPTVFLSSDAPDYLGRIDWRYFAAYRADHPCLVGLTASIPEYGNSPLPGRLRWAAEHEVDFYYSFRAPAYLESRRSYRPFFEEGYRILSVEFGANPLLYRPVPGVARDLDYVFLASSNSDKRPRYYEYLAGILAEHPGFINGPGWSHSRAIARAEVHRFLYARARVGINLHIADSIDWPSELNERTYILAACGVPQLVDGAKLLPDRFPADAFFVADNPRDYQRLFGEILAHPEEAFRRARVALRHVFARHTTFHRAEAFLQQLQSLTRP
jgi:hypothetical protein